MQLQAGDVHLRLHKASSHSALILFCGFSELEFLSLFLVSNFPRLDGMPLSFFASGIPHRKAWLCHSADSLFTTPASRSTITPTPPLSLLYPLEIQSFPRLNYPVDQTYPTISSDLFFGVAF